jgi:hypothetical protein
VPLRQTRRDGGGFAILEVLFLEVLYCFFFFFSFLFCSLTKTSLRRTTSPGIPAYATAYTSHRLPHTLVCAVDRPCSTRGPASICGSTWQPAASYPSHARRSIAQVFGGRGICPPQPCKYVSRFWHGGHPKATLPRLLTVCATLRYRTTDRCAPSNNAVPRSHS